MPKTIGIIDADLLDNGTRHPNLALMKISGYQKELGNDVTLLEDYYSIPKYDEVYLSRVFDFTNVPIDPKNYPNLHIGGTGFFWMTAPDLPLEVEHHMPDYHLYDEYVGRQIARGIKPQTYSDYMDYSIGFTTRGCFRKCPFCVNQKYDHVFRHSPVKEFFDPSRKHIYLWDDQFFGFPKWQEVLDELHTSAQGLTPEEAEESLFGFTCANDVTAREVQKVDPLIGHCKSYDTFCPIGPWIETELEDINDLSIRCLVNGEVRQSANTGDMIFRPLDLLCFLSRVMTLMPGDVILTGTPPGISPIQADDVVQVSIEGIGTLSNPVEGPGPEEKILQ